MNIPSLASLMYIEPLPCRVGPDEGSAVACDSILPIFEVTVAEVALEANLVIDYEADSVDVVAMLLYLEDMFKNASETTRTVVPTDKLGQIVLVEDILDIIYEVLLGIESKMETFVPIKPDFDALEKRQKMGELYPKE